MIVAQLVGESAVTNLPRILDALVGSSETPSQPPSGPAGPSPRGASR